MRLIAPTLVIALAAIPIGCSTFEDISKGLDHLVGRDINKAISILGYPDDERVIAGKTIYFWRNSRSSTSTIPTYSTSTGYIGGSKFSASTTGQSAVTTSLNCEIKIITGKSNKILTWEYNGNLGACRKYSKRLSARAPTIKSKSIRGVVPQTNNKTVATQTEVINDLSLARYM